MADGLVVLFKGHSQYGSVNAMVDQLAQALERLGAPTAILDTRAADCVASAVALLRQRRVRLFLSLNGFGIPAAGQGAGFYAESAAPVLIYFVDHPAYHLSRLRAPLPRLIATFPTAHHADFCRRFIRDDIAIHHLPHATAAAAAAPWRGRDLALFLSASLMADPEPFRAQWRQHGAEVAARLDATVEAHDAAPTRPLHEIVLAALGGAAPPIEVLASYVITVDTYLRSRVKLALAQALAHLPLTLCGEGWARHAAPGQRAAFLPATPVAETVAAMRRSKIVLNPLPPYYESHERPLQAMVNGAVAAEGPNAAMAAAFPGGYLDLPADPREAAAALEAALAAEGRLQAIAEAGHAACLAGHLWEHRAAEILRLAAAG
ncbi:MAG TPA: glycosyltransferase [Stellaceae bacterium]|nr:glycosyltransferase [Stellaceae bacterium]